MALVDKPDHAASHVPSTSSNPTQSSSESDETLSHSSTSVCASSIPLPTFSDRVSSAVLSKNVLPELDRMVEETAYHILKFGDMVDRGDYEMFGRRLYEEFPCVEFPGVHPVFLHYAFHLCYMFHNYW